MNGRKAISIPSIAISATLFIMVLLVSPFMFEVLGVSDISGVEGFFARLIPFVMLWTALRMGFQAGFNQ